MPFCHSALLPSSLLPPILSSLNGKRICILGFGREGKAAYSAIRTHAAPTSITIADRDTALVVPEDAQTKLGPEYMKDLENFDLVIKSPGIPPCKEIETIQSVMTTSTQLFMEHAKAVGCTVIGVTGSKGKSTTSTLIAEILNAGKKPVLFAGNIGEPSIAHIGELLPETIVVLEMSSYQLMDCTLSPQIAVVTSFFPEHLDYHASASLGTGLSPLELYMDAKKHITRYQESKDIVFYAAASEGAASIAACSPGKHVGVRTEECPVDLSDTHLLGEHNRSNIALAFAVSQHMGIEPSMAVDVIRNFRGLPHRLQSLGIHHDLEWIDDAISTTPESTIAALDALGDRVQTIILGGQDRGYDFTGLAKRIGHSSIRHIILFPGSGPRIREALTKESVTATMTDVASMEEAVDQAKKVSQISNLKSQISPIVLLSTASPSYGMFKNFEEKGGKFAEQILKA
jgi:UDP-N-acetylmuramoylalanine--D-glutamate ligase